MNSGSTRRGWLATTTGGAKIDVETVADGVDANCESPYSDAEDTFHYTAERDAEITLEVYHAGIPEVTVETVAGT